MITTLIQKEPDETDKKILKYLSDGVTVKQIAYELNLSSFTVSWRIREMKKYYNCKSIAHLVATLKIV